MKIITKEWLKEKRACADGMRWFLSQNETDTAKVMVKLVEEKRCNDALWILKNVSSTEQLCRVAVFAAKQVLPIYEAYERSNDAPRKAIAAAELAIANPTEENKHAAGYAAANADHASYAASDAADAAAYASAADAADAAAYAVYCASDAACYAARAAVDASAAASYAAYAVYCASDAAYAVYCSAYYAADASADSDRKEMQLKIINYAIEICGL